MVIIIGAVWRSKRARLARRRHEREIAANEEAEEAAAELRHVQAEEVVSAEMQQEILRQTIESGELRLRSLEAEIRFERGRDAHGGTAREEVVRRDDAQASQAFVDTGSVHDEVIAELYERMQSQEAKAHPVFRTSERIRRREEFTFTEDEGPGGRS